ncbi:MAG: DUF4743 domain-containing protein [Magnetospiraceae bacterium]
MGFLYHIRVCNRHDLTGLIPWFIGTQHVGWLSPVVAAQCALHPELFHISDQGVALSETLTNPAQRTAQMLPFLKGLFDQGLLTAWRDEPYAVTDNFNDPPLMTVDRGAASALGIRSYGVHVNGYVRQDDGLYLWIGTRAEDRDVAPGMLDNMVAGGQPAGLSLMDNLQKECAEEANLAPALAVQARPVGIVRYTLSVPQGLRRDTLFLYDLEMPPEIIPVNTDGEVASFALLPALEVAEIVRSQNGFKFNCNLVIIDFLVRHGLLGPEEADYEAIVMGLRQE